MTALKIEWDGEVYGLDLEEITLKQAMVTQDYLGQSIMKAFGLISEMAKADDVEDTPELFRLIGALHWLMLAQSGVRTPIADLDFPLLKFMTALFGAMAEMAPAEPVAEPGPTVPPPGPALSAPSTETPAQEPSPSTAEEVPATASGT